ncbi:Predicted membrane protein [Leishmania donovani]|uniref:Predicted_membrane_protein_-_putative n=3 Tax=Leishmania donovani species complex TaxID=38574 RepID=A0A6L0XTN9_LEIIN|nr:conserved hypothetical protein [Leishmania infantum JPCM5]CAC9536688.1 Predicted_membrane_protein_-_putative [Leishmania infantum]CAJ1992416.1 Predicted membrane protein [Leishmania donovani]CAM71898.1 conserved hypothetical protein [Leishmania infantum JPCM5]SUZ45437.1 Predicted_membrane_protein_-_putative [Leishmania infantum]VDZ48249.1 Predicted_membrane_protein_putative/Pfam:PF09799 [Leishmania donovani]|eukprot:XP_001468809.1 conserved hypothetical protein [Leishmania infantum JPCM5]
MPTSGSTTGGASFPFHLQLLTSIGCAAIWWIVTLGLLIFKALYLPFPPAALPMEVVASFLVLLVNAFGVFIGMRGNKMESTSAIVISTVLLSIAAVGAIYYMWLQTYVLMMDLAFSATYLGINGVAILLGFWATQSVARLAQVPVFKLEVESGRSEKKKN